MLRQSSEVGRTGGELGAVVGRIGGQEGRVVSRALGYGRALLEVGQVVDG